MSTGETKRVLLCVGAGIAAYKCCELVRRLGDAGATVQVVLTERAGAFITPLTLQALSGRPVRTALFDAAAEAAMGHIELARWADCVLYAPATADLIARLAAGLADDLATTLALATRAPLAVAPAMNQQMWQHAATQRNVARLRELGVHVFGPAAGEQACGDVGPGRMLEPQALCDLVLALARPVASPPAAAAGSVAAGASGTTALRGRHVLITAGPTREAIDPVRYVSNHSSGKQGFALAAAAVRAGARVTLVSGPVSLDTPAGVERVDVTTACEMHDAVMRLVGSCDVFIGVAAVADYRARTVPATKIKKQPGQPALLLELIENPDILASVGHLARRPFTVGFAAETDDGLANARSKRLRKGADMIVLNDVSDRRIGFASDDNAVTLVCADGEESLPQAAKAAIADAIIDRIGRRLAAAS
jgi:phosphopantothenoylcysteine decarboxylase/phosphopantothenate--cysteine ligase